MSIEQMKDLDTYEMKKEPEANPNNNTRIINAGFDLKTSFRKMKKNKGVEI